MRVDNDMYPTLLYVLKSYYKKSTHMNRSLQFSVFIILILLSATIKAQELPYRMDSTFADNGVAVVTSSVYSIFYDQKVRFMQVTGDGKIVLGGFAGGMTQVGVVRLNHNGSMDSSFNSSGFMNFGIGSSYAGQLEAMKVANDGSIFLAGSADYAASSQYAVYKISANGTLDPTFGSGGTVLVPSQFQFEQNVAMDLQSDGKILLGGFVIENSGMYVYMVTRLLPNGNVDNTFGQNGRVTCPYTTLMQYSPMANGCNVLRCQPDGKILVSGYYTNMTLSNNELFIVRYKADGTIDSSFGQNGLLTRTVATNNGLNVRHIDINSQGTIYAVCDKMGIDGKYIVAYKVSNSGVIDNTYGNNGMAEIDSFQMMYPFGYTSMMIQHDSLLLFAGTRDTGVNLNDYAVYRLNAQGNTDTTFGDHGIFRYIRGKEDVCAAAALTSNDDIYMAGYGKINTALDTTYPTCIRITNRPYNDTTSGIANVSVPHSVISVYPNPSPEGIYTINYTMPSAQTAMLQLYDVNGKKLQQTIQQLQRKGAFTYRIPANAGKGIYYLKCICGKQTLSTIRLLY